MFPCTNCGICCKKIACIPELKTFDRGDGVCSYLDEATNSCTIYDKRPEICRVDLLYSKYFATRYSKEEFYHLNAKACNTMQEAESLDESFRVRIKNRE